MLRLSHWTDRGLGAGLLGVIDPTGSLDLQTVEGRLDHRIMLADRLGVTVQVDAAQTRQTLDKVTWLTASVLFPQGLRVNSATEQEVLRLRTDVRFNASDRHFITAGVGYEQARYRIDALDPSGSIAFDPTLLMSPGTSLSSMGFGSTALNPVFLGYASALSQLLSASRVSR